MTQPGGCNVAEWGFMHKMAVIGTVACRFGVDTSNPQHPGVVVATDIVSADMRIGNISHEWYEHVPATQVAVIR